MEPSGIYRNKTRKKEKKQTIANISEEGIKQEYYDKQIASEKKNKKNS